MRYLIILSGNSLKNKAWGEAVLAHYGEQFDSAYLQNYTHWDSGEPSIDFAVEETKLAEHVSSLSSGTEITLMAKSAGSLLAFLAIDNKIVTPVRCIFLGIPFDLASDNLFKNNWNAIDSFTIPAVAFHNIADPTTSYDFTKATLEKHASHITLITTQESDHWYADFTTYDQHLKF